MNRFSYTRSGNPFGEKSVDVDGLTVYPVLMKDYCLWLECKPALELRLSSLPVQFATKPYLSAMWGMEMNAAMAGKPLGLVSRLNCLLKLSLRTGPEIGNTMMFTCKEGSKDELISAAIFQTDDPVIFKPHEFDRLREAIAKINGVCLPDESESPELVEALKIRGEMSGAALEPHAEDLIDSVALASGLKMSDLEGWTVREFELRRMTIERAKRFELNAIAEGNGAKFKHGNPYPDWKFERAESIYGGFTPIEELLSNIGAQENSAGINPGQTN